VLEQADDHPHRILRPSVKLELAKRRTGARSEPDRGRNYSGVRGGKPHGVGNDLSVSCRRFITKLEEESVKGVSIDAGVLVPVSSGFVGKSVEIGSSGLVFWSSGDNSIFGREAFEDLFAMTFHLRSEFIEAALVGEHDNASI
jgi:hypothetical protein